MQLIILLACSVVVSVKGLNNGLARTPPMGWMSWQRFGCTTNCTSQPDECISDKLFRRTADLMSSDGYLKAGYEYLIIDDCWLAKERDAQGRLQPDPERFPYGIKDLSDYIHSKGLKFGLYEDFGTKTCAGYPGILGHLEIDAQTFAEWGVDYTKIDGCYVGYDRMEEGYAEFGKYLNKTGRPIVYSCSWPAYWEMDNKPANYSLLAKICNLWRNWGDIGNSYGSVVDIMKWFGDNQDRFAPFAGPGHWNDPDMLLIGNDCLNYEQSKTQMAIWAILAAPLLMSVDFKTIKSPYKEILLHKGVIAISQDPLGIQGRRVDVTSKLQIWIRPITPVKDSEYSYAIAFHNVKEDKHPYPATTTLKDLGLNNTKGYIVNDVFEPKEKSKALQINDKFTVKIPPLGVVLIKAVPVTN